MKLVKYIFIAIVLFSFEMNAQNDILIGETSKEELKSNSNFSWFDDYYKSYEVDSSLLKPIKKLLDDHNYKLEVYFGTWCTDSQREVPSLIKVLDQINFDYNNLKMIAVDEDKIVPNLSDEQRQKLNIEYVPTIIVFKDGKEVNRYVEYARETLEKDLVKILSQQPYKHSYN
jgi:thiol-disulfide isomerase/thioredoxin